MKIYISYDQKEVEEQVEEAAAGLGVDLTDEQVEEIAKDIVERIKEDLNFEEVAQACAEEYLEDNGYTEE